ncbi:MAG: TIR domain-containing protein [Gemmatimonadetes bacterium]|nr:MAG: TIR domain-containing protein [Gemmatimonadota bacterium]
MPEFKDVFISYGRRESKFFAIRLHDRLTAAGYSVWLDQNDIRAAEDFQQAIDVGIVQAHNFIFIIAPRSVESEYCRKEIDQAVRLGKRIIPILHITASEQQMHPVIRKLNWLLFEEKYDADTPPDQWEPVYPFEADFQTLQSVLEDRREYVEHHTQLLNQAIAWENHQRSTAYLLVGAERHAAQKWLLTEFKEQPPCHPTDLQCDYICESRKNADNLMTDCFISYTSTDQAIREKVRRVLSRHLITTWTHDTDVQKGSKLDDAIRDGVIQADNFLFFISHESVQSEYCQKELAYVQQYHKRIIPLRIEAVDPADLPPLIQGLQSIDFTDNREEADFERDIDELLKEIYTDREYFWQHKVFLAQAIKWQRQGGNASILLRGHNLEKAKIWLKLGEQRTTYPPTKLHKQFILESDAKREQLHSEVFISYSRADSDVARKLNEELQIHGKTTWFDLESIAAGEDFKQEILRGIETADNFLFLISPHSVKSRYCKAEIAHAQQFNKRIVTLRIAPTPDEDVPEAIRSVQRIDWTNPPEFHRAFSELIRTLDTDREHVRNHTKWSQRAQEWEHNHRPEDLLLGDSELPVALEWLETARAENKQPPPTPLQQEWIGASLNRRNKREKRQQQLKQLNILGLVALVVMILFAIFYEKRESDEITQSVQDILLSASQAVSPTDFLHGFYLAERAFTLSFPAVPPPITRQLAQLHQELYTRADSIARTTGVPPPFKTIRTERRVQSFEYSPDGSHIVTLTGTGVIEVWSVADLQRRCRLVAPDTLQFSSAVFVPNREEILTTTRTYSVQFWSLDGEFRREITLIDSGDTDTGPVDWADISADGRRILTRHQPAAATGIPEVTSQWGAIKLWHSDGTSPQVLSSSYSLARFSPSDRWIVISKEAYNQPATLWNEDGKYLAQLDPPIEQLAVTTDHHRIVGTYGTHLGIWSVQDSIRTDLDLQDIMMKSLQRDEPLISPVRLQKLRTLDVHDAPLTALDISPTGEYILTASEDNSARLWSMEGQWVDLFLHADDVQEAKFSPQGQTLATATGHWIVIYPVEQSPLKWAAVNSPSLYPTAQRLYQKHGSFSERLSQLAQEKKLKFGVQWVLFVLALSFLLIQTIRQFRRHFQECRYFALVLYTVGYLSTVAFWLVLAKWQLADFFFDFVLVLATLLAAVVSFLALVRYYDQKRQRYFYMVSFLVLFAVLTVHVAPHMNNPQYQSNVFLPVLWVTPIKVAMFYAFTLLLNLYYSGRRRLFWWFVLVMLSLLDASIITVWGLDQGDLVTDTGFYLIFYSLLLLPTLAVVYLVANMVRQMSLYYQNRQFLAILLFGIIDGLVIAISTLTTYYEPGLGILILGIILVMLMVLIATWQWFRRQTKWVGKLLSGLFMLGVSIMTFYVSIPFALIWFPAKRAVTAFYHQRYTIFGLWLLLPVFTGLSIILYILDTVGY